jgi:hypothetical protein
VVPLHVPHVGGYPGRQRVRAADLLDLRSDIEVIQVGVVAAIAADELVRVGVTAFRLAADDADRLAPQGDRPELTGLAANRPVNRYVAEPGSRWPAVRLRGGYICHILLAPLGADAWQTIRNWLTIG